MMKKYIKIEFSSENELPLRKALQLHHIILVARSLFHEISKFYPHIFLDKCLYKSAG